MGSPRMSDACVGNHIFPDRSAASPFMVPIHNVPCESSNRELTSYGNPSLPEYECQRLFEKALNPRGVANHIAPSRVSRIDEIVFEIRPFAVVNVSNFPFLIRVRPALSVPAQIVPLRLTRTV